MQQSGDERTAIIGPETGPCQGCSKDRDAARRPAWSRKATGRWGQQDWLTEKEFLFFSTYSGGHWGEAVQSRL